ncbi:7815_t:CDS:2, partial [Racocetra fulgida]
MSLITNTQINVAMSDKYHDDNKEESSKKFDFLKPHGTYKNDESKAWTEHYVCSRSGNKQIRNDRVEGGHTQKKRRTQKVSKKVGCQCDLRINYYPNTFSNEIVIARYRYKHSGHVLGSRDDIQYLKKSEETITKIKTFAHYGLSLSAIRQLMKAPEEITKRYLIIHIDSTHSTTAYKYALFTILIRHPYSGRGISLAWFLTESCDTQAIMTWLRKLKEDGWEDPKNVILDNDEAEINAIYHDSLFYDLDQLLNIDNESSVNCAITQFEEKWKDTPAKCGSNAIGTTKSEEPTPTILLRYYRQEVIQYELNIGRMGPHRKILRKFEINSADIEDSSIFRLQDSVFIVKSTQGGADYIVEHNNSDFTCN